MISGTVSFFRWNGEIAMASIVVANNLFKEMQSYKTLECNQKERQQLKHTFIDKIKDKVSLRWDRANKLLQVIDEIIYKATDRGYSFNGRETLAEKCKVSIRTVDKAIKILKESNEVVVAYRHNPSSNGYKTPIIILKAHKHFGYWKSLLNIEDNVECEVEASSNSGDSKAHGMKMDLYLSNTKKQESNNINNPSHNKIVQFVANRVQDSIKTGTKIKYLSSYINKLMQSLENQALYAENMRQVKLKQQQQAAFSKLAEELGVKKTKKQIPFYDWLND